MVDFIMYIVVIIIYHRILPQDFKEELGGVLGCMGGLVLTIIYIILFGVIDLDFIDFFNYIINRI